LPLRLGRVLMQGSRMISPATLSLAYCILLAAIVIVPPRY
jgi:hypothetical protein